jgi:uncharacterized membrane protein
MEQTHNDPNQKKIVRLYAAFGAGLALSFMPSGIAALISLALILGVLMVAYAWRTDSEEDGLLANHMTFIIRTIWIGGFLALATIAVAAIYLNMMLDNTPLQPCADDIFNFVNAGDLMNFDPLITAISGKCLVPYLARNLTSFIISGVIGILPVLIYFIVRFLRGFTRAQNGYRVAKPKAWF